MSEPGIHLFIGFRGVGIEEELKYLIREYRPGGIVLFKRNIEGREQLKTLVAARRRLRWKNSSALFSLPSIRRVGASRGFLPTSARFPRQGRLRARARGCRPMGRNVRGRPQGDRNPDKLRSRSRYSCRRESNILWSPAHLVRCPATVSDLGTIWIETLQANGISATAKHFPGLGRAELDPHHFSPVIAYDNGDDFYLDLMPFRSAIRAGVNCVMTSHAVYRAVDNLYPATLSNEINHRWLRERLGFGGVLFGDDLDMAAISENYSPEETAFLGLSCSMDFFLLCQKSESIEPMHRAIADQLDRNQSLQGFHCATIRRLEMLRLFHFPE